MLCIFNNISLDTGCIGWHQLDALGQCLNSLKARRSRRGLAQSFFNSFGKLDRQRCFHHDHRHARLQVLARDLHAISSVGVNNVVELRMNVLNGGQAICMGAFATCKTIVFRG